MPLTTPDIFPTLLGLAGVRIPARRGRGFVPAAPQWAGEDRAALYMACRRLPTRIYPAIPGHPHRSLHLCCGLEGPWLLFDDVKDPHQMNNLVAKPEFAALCVQLDGACKRNSGRSAMISGGRAYLEQWGYHVNPGSSVPYGNEK